MFDFFFFVRTQAGHSRQTLGQFHILFKVGSLKNGDDSNWTQEASGFLPPGTLVSLPLLSLPVLAFRTFSLNFLRGSQKPKVAGSTWPSLGPSPGHDCYTDDQQCKQELELCTLSTPPKKKNDVSVVISGVKLEGFWST